MRESHRDPSGGRPVRIPASIWILAAMLAAAIGYRALANRPSSPHPEPRSGITAADVVPASRWADRPDVARAYEAASEIPHILDGLHCYCDCARNFGHRSLLSCFESDHGADCDICWREALIAWQMNAQGRSLQEIRTRIDALMKG